MRVERTGNVRPGRDRDTKGRLWERRRLATAWAAGDDADTDTDADGHGQHGGADGDDDDDDAAAAAAGADASDAPPLVVAHRRCWPLIASADVMLARRWPLPLAAHSLTRTYMCIHTCTDGYV